jgi:hypothetical protein
MNLNEYRCEETRVHDLIRASLNVKDLTIWKALVGKNLLIHLTHTRQS